MSKEEPKMNASREAVLSKFKKLRKPVLGQDELILLLLGLLDKPVNGRTVLMKELFLLYKELESKIPVAEPNFYKYKYGPYSHELLLIVELMSQYGYISIKNKRVSRATKYYLTEKGKKIAQAIIERISTILGKDYIDRLKQLRIGWDQMGHDGILNYVYQRFPEYREKSLVKEKYRVVDWGVAEA